MQAKGFIRLILIALLAVSIFQLSFTLIKSKYVKNAEHFAQTQTSNLEEGLDKAFKFNQEKNHYLDSIKTEKVFLNFFTYDEIDRRSLNLGLDLKGGVSMLIEIDQADVLHKLSNNSKDPVFNQAIEEAVKAQSSNQDDFITLFGKKYKELAKGAKLATIFAPIEKFREKIDFNSSDDDVLAIIKEQVTAKNSETHNVLTTRIDEFGVAQPFISAPDANGRIYIELPGAENTDRIRRIIQSAAVLEFYETVDAAVTGEMLVKANDMLVGLLGLEEVEKEDTSIVEAIDTSATATVSDSTKSELENALNADNDLSNLDNVEDSTGKAFNPLFNIFMPNINSQEGGGNYWSKGAVVGYAAKKDLEKVKAYLEMEEIKSMFDVAKIKLAWSAKPFRNQDGTITDIYMLYGLKKTLDGKAALNGDVITDAFPTIGQTGGFEVSMSMNPTGANTWSKLTGENVDRQIAIVLDDKIFSAPNVNQQITGGRSSISGLDDFEEAKDLANILKSGKLDAKINIPQEAVVGASLGKAAIKQGILALIIGFLTVVLFMVLYYSGGGIIANIALIANIILIMGTLASMGAALTLPGLAGIVLTIGMAVDANVIIFERIKEELRKGKGFKLAVADGYSRSYSSIIDSNVTTLITAATLLWLGAGPVKGFAIVLIIGIIASFISAVFLSRLIFEGLMDRNKTIKISSSWSENLLQNTNFDFLGKRKLFYALSSAIIIAGLVSMFTKGFELGVDFKGGRSYVVAFDQTVSTDVIRKELTETFENAEPQVKTFGNDRTVQIITSYQVESTDPKMDSTVTAMLYNQLKDNFKKEPTASQFMASNLIQSNKVDTSIADDIKNSAIKAGLVGAFLIFIYLLIRFRKWQFGVGALVAVLHDALILLSIFSIFWGKWFPFSLEIEQKFIAAILTVIGYSINDTVIVFDRIREHFDEHPTKSILQNVNDAINNTLSRTLMTSFTTIIVVLILFVFGGEAIRGFSFALLMGILVGTYSSIFIASAIVVDTLKSTSKKFTK